MLLAAIALLQTPAADKTYFLTEVTAKFFVIAYEQDPAPKILFPLPRDYRAQVPLTFELNVTPKEALVSGRTFETRTGDQIMELTFAPMKKEQRVDVAWKSIVIADVTETFSIPKAVPFPEKYPVDVAEWLKPTRYVQSTHPKIMAVAAKFKTADSVETLNKTIDGCTAILRNQRKMADDLSSVEALDKTGSCTSNANLMAALLRANNIPARMLAGFPEWADGPFQTHYIVEAYIDGYGWYPIEPTKGVGGWKCSSMPIVSIISTENESRGIRRVNIAGGVPYLSLTESVTKVVTGGTLSKDFSPHFAKIVGSAKFSDVLWTDAEAKWAAWIKKTGTQVKDLTAILPLGK